MNIESFHPYIFHFLTTAHTDGDEMEFDEYDIDTVYDALIEGTGSDENVVNINGDHETWNIVLSLFWIRVNPDSPKFDFFVILGEDVKRLPDDWNVNDECLKKNASMSMPFNACIKYGETITGDLMWLRLHNSAGMVIHSRRHRYYVIGLKRSLIHCAQSVAEAIGKSRQVTPEWCALWTSRNLECLMEMPEALEIEYFQPRRLLPSTKWLGEVNDEVSS